MSTRWRTIFSSSPSKRKVVLERHQLTGEDRPQHQGPSLSKGYDKAVVLQISLAVSQLISIAAPRSRFNDFYGVLGRATSQ
jgi:hypothetical protein